jgi:D-alanyl-D-alanine dipeptidase
VAIAKGSIIYRGGVVDITLRSICKELSWKQPLHLISLAKKQLIIIKNLSMKVNAIGKILKSVMISSGFNPSDSEWWHYNLKSGLKDNVSCKMELQPSFTSNIR